MSSEGVINVIESVIQGREQAYESISVLEVELTKLINYAISERDPRCVHQSELATAELISSLISSLSFDADLNVGRDLWELVSEDSQAQWLEPPLDEKGVLISLVNVANNMAKNECYIEFI
jgi:hypothetical protein